MKGNKIYIIGNWKSNKNRQDVENWFTQLVSENVLDNKLPNKEVVVCPSFIHLELAKWLIEKNKLSLKLGAQDVSPFSTGAYTGEVSASMLKNYAEYTLIGHSERRKYFKEDDDMLSQKVQMAKDEGLKVIYCVPDDTTIVPNGVDIVAYEPIWAIGTGKTDSPQNANALIGHLKQKYPSCVYIYGGSVTADNIVSFVSQDYIDGVLPGGASLDPIKFSKMISAINSL